LEDAVDDFVRGGAAVWPGFTLPVKNDDPVLTEVLEPVGFTDWLPCAENVLDPLVDDVILLERVEAIEPVCCIVETTDFVVCKDPVDNAEEVLEFNDDRESDWTAVLEVLLAPVRVAEDDPVHERAVVVVPDSVTVCVGCFVDSGDLDSDAEAEAVL